MTIFKCTQNSQNVAGGRRRQRREWKGRKEGREKEGKEEGGRRKDRWGGGREGKKRGKGRKKGGKKEVKFFFGLIFQI